ncbi:glycosyltransferase [Cyanobium sp. T1B-Tous]|uniref:glycosyltransferase n=1 Tax=Cyanobium sp. T1B-Tous TaxID=2823721 RepID=UPI0020CB7E9C|nr:glycosyltransferase [Cyanobium sp. T1B-Tous]
MGLAVMLALLERTFAAAPSLQAPPAGVCQADTSCTVVVPAYNEADNIADCVRALLASESPCQRWTLVVVDDDSGDATADLAQAAAAGDPHFVLLQAGPRPPGERWVGKNWACHRACQGLDSDWVAFIDADVRVEPGALRAALADAIAEGSDLLTLAPRLRSGCLAEWLVQPIIASLLGLGFPIQRANDPADPLAFAAGPFLLFRSQAYRAIGGHAAVAGEVVEDLALARAIKGQGLRLRYLLGLDWLTLRMYRDFAALWEGWTKNWLLGLDRNVPKALAAGALVLQLYAVPWLLLPLALGLAVLDPAPLAYLPLLLALLAIGLQLAIRFWSRRRFGTPLHWWWLAGIGGLVIGAIAPVSVWKTLSGRGWTWRGRSLQSPG